MVRLLLRFTIKSTYNALLTYIHPSRFITGLADTQTELTRSRPTFFPPPSEKLLQFPLSLRETRHCIVHRHLPSLAELKRAAKESLDWLWEWYWSHLDAALSVDATASGPAHEVSSERDVRERLQSVLKGYIRARKMEIRTRAKVKNQESKATQAAISSCLFLEAATTTKHKLLVQLLVNEKAILPVDKQMGSSMSGAFLIWTPFLVSLCEMSTSFLTLLLDSLVEYMCAPGNQRAENVKNDAAREGMHDWAIHVLSSKEWAGARRERTPNSSLGRNIGTEVTNSKWQTHVLDHVFTAPSFWALKLAESLLSQDDEILGKASWFRILGAARSGDDDVEMGSGEPTEQATTIANIHGGVGFNEATMDVDMPSPSSVVKNRPMPLQKLKGPQKKVGLWKPRPVGTVLQGWEVDE